MTIDADLCLITLVLGTLAYGIYSKSSSRNAGYDATPPPQKSVTPPALPSLLPGVPESLLRALQNVVDSPGATLAGPVAPKGMEPDRLHDLVNTVVKRIQQDDVVCTALDGGSCVADAEGSEQYDLTCMLYDKNTNVSVQIHLGILALDDGSVLVTKLEPGTKVQVDALAVQENPWKLEPTPYSLPINGV